jgi:hypothetical protein
MGYIVTWNGPHGWERKKASTAAVALGFLTSRSTDASNFVIKDEEGKRVSADDLKRLAAT